MLCVAHALARRAADSRTVSSSFAGSGGVEPPLAVLETTVLPLNDDPSSLPACRQAGAPQGKPLNYLDLGRSWVSVF